MPTLVPIPESTNVIERKVSRVRTVQMGGIELSWVLMNCVLSELKICVPERLKLMGSGVSYLGRHALRGDHYCSDEGLQPAAF